LESSQCLNKSGFGFPLMIHVPLIASLHVFVSARGYMSAHMRHIP